ncbi:MAG: hypothetical protein ACK5PF_08490 [bacterium]|jgi:hypothetical protein
MATKQAPKKPFKVGQKVNFVSRTRKGVGKIIAIRPSLTGDWYDVRYDNDNVVSVRASQVVAI